MSKSLFIRLFIMLLSLAGIVYLLGPVPEVPKFAEKLPHVASYRSIEQYIAEKESQFDIKEGCEAKVVWHKDSMQRTTYVILYLHGFSASHAEGYPVHTQIAEEFGANLFLSRLCDHGLNSTDNLLNFSADCYWESAKEALMIARSLGDSVIVMSTSTGGTAALLLASKYPYIHSLINLSPNIEVNNPNAFLLNLPWGLKIARMVIGGKYRLIEGSEEYAKYWDTKYRLESVVELEQLLSYSMMPETFEKIDIPVMNGYYYKNDEEQDQVVKVSAILDMHEDLSTPDHKKRLVAFPNVENHVLASPIKSNDVQSVHDSIHTFMTEVLKIKSLK